MFGPAELTYNERIDLLRKTKMQHTEEKWRALGHMDMDDHGLILPPPESRKVVTVTSGSGFTMTDALFKEFVPKSNHPSGGFFGARANGENFRALLEMHPTYIDPMSSLAGGYMVNFLSYRSPPGIPISITPICTRNKTSTSSIPASAPSSISART